MHELSKAEIAGLQAIVEETHRELVNGTPPAVISPKCNQCAKRIVAKCSQYPHGIPKIILTNRQSCEAFEEK